MADMSDRSVPAGRSGASIHALRTRLDWLRDHLIGTLQTGPDLEVAEIATRLRSYTEVYNTLLWVENGLGKDGQNGPGRKEPDGLDFERARREVEKRLERAVREGRG